MSTLKRTKLVLLYKLYTTNLTNATRLTRNPVGVFLVVSIDLKSSFNFHVIDWSSRLEGRLVALMKGHCKSRRTLTKRSWGLLRVSAIESPFEWLPFQGKTSLAGKDEEIFELRCFFHIEALTCEKVLESFNKVAQDNFWFRYSLHRRPPKILQRHACFQSRWGSLQGRLLWKTSVNCRKRGWVRNGQRRKK